jgi:hypothetical protein
MISIIDRCRGPAFLGALLIATAVALAADEPKKDGAAAKPAPDAVELKLELPKPLFAGTPKNLPPGTTVEKPTGKPRPPLMVPKGTQLLSRDKPVKLSDDNPIAGKAEMVTDGMKEGSDGNWVEMGPGLQWVQVDLGKSAEIAAIAIWHYHAEPRVYHDVVVQVADDADFIENVHTVFNNDQDNSAGLGLGKDNEYFELAEGKLIDAKGVKGRYVRCYTKGSTSDEQNHCIEVEVFGRWVKQ